MIEEINDWVDTFCLVGQGATYPADMHEASGYLSGRTSTTLEAHYNGAGIPETRLRDYARDSIKYRDTPAIIGVGWLMHYPLAYGYAYQERIVRYCFVLCWDEVVYDRSFYLNQGWGGSGQRVDHREHLVLRRDLSVTGARRVSGSSGDPARVPGLKELHRAPGSPDIQSKSARRCRSGRPSKGRAAR